jgi:perosamine synthetase
MINLNLAPNETFSDALASFLSLFQPWRWKRGKEQDKVKKEILKKYFNVTSYRLQVTFFLSGRSALSYLLKSLNLKKGDEVLVQAFTCEAVVLPIVALNLKPVFFDIEKQSFSANPIDLEKKLSEKSKVVILQHTFGITPSQREKILSIIRRNHLVLIEDIAHGIKSKVKRQKLKVLKNHFYLLSFGRSKSLSSVFGGAVVTNNKTFAKKLDSFNLPYPSYSLIFKLLIYKPIAFITKLTYNIYLGKILHFFSQKFNLLIPEITKKEKAGEYDHFFDKKYPNALAILLLNQLKRLDKIQNQRKKMVNFYLKNLNNVTSYKLQVTGSIIRFPLLIENRDKILQNLAKKGIFLGRWYDSPVAPKGFPLDKVGYKWGSCPVAEAVCQKIINLPTNNIKLNEAEKLTKILNDVIYENQNHK